MFSRIRTHTSFANVVSIMALFVALSGTAYAAVKLPKNSVGARQIKKNGVGASEIKRNAVGSSEVKNASLKRADFAAGQLPDGTPGPRGLQGEKGEKGEKGDKGDTGDTGTFGAVTVQTTKAAPLADGAKVSVDATCPAGQSIIGGGGRGDDQESEYTVLTSTRPFRDPGDAPLDDQNFTRWRVTVFNPSGNPPTLGNPAGPIEPEVWAICAQPNTPAP